MISIEISEETHERLSVAVKEADESHAKHPEYNRGPATESGLAESYVAGELDRRDEARLIAEKLFRPLHGRT